MSVFGEMFVGVMVSGHTLFAVFRLPFSCKIPPHHTANIINAKKIRFDGRTKTADTDTDGKHNRKHTDTRKPLAVARFRLFRKP